MIADVVSLAIAGSGFCQMAGCLILYRRVIAGMNTVMPQKRTRRHRYRERIISALTKDP
jgi:hypothetical protein